jgi:catechol 2,3-dioxygenase-like lactoylglutathione lyase family enzyme
VVQIHHAGICPADLEASLRFYVEGVGLEVILDITMPVDLEPLLGVTTSSARTVFLGSAEDTEAGMLELLDLGTDRVAEQAPAVGLPSRGLCLVSFQTPVEPALARLAALGLGGPPRRLQTRGNLAATVVDPDGVVVELMDRAMRMPVAKRVS